MCGGKASHFWWHQVRHPGDQSNLKKLQHSVSKNNTGSYGVPFVQKDVVESEHLRTVASPNQHQHIYPRPFSTSR